MPWNGSGSFTRNNGTNSGASTWVDDRDAGAKILASRHDTHDEDIATGLENCLTRDGQNSPSANIGMGTYRWTNNGNAAALTDLPTVGQVLNGGLYWAGATGGTSTAYTATLPISPGSYVAGLMVLALFNQTNGASPTINFNGLGAKDLATTAGSFIANGYIVANSVYLLVYDGTRFIVVGAAND